MPHVLGIDLGADDTVVAVCPLDPARPVEPRVLALERTPGVRSALDIGSDGTVRCGSSVDGFVARVGDPAPVMVDGHPYPAHELAAVFVACVLNRATALLGEEPVRTVLTHPAGWGPQRLGPLRQALHHQGLDTLVLVSAPVAAAHACAATAPVVVLDAAADPVEAVVVAPAPASGEGHRRFRLAGPTIPGDGRCGGPDPAGGWPQLATEVLERAATASGTPPSAVVLTGRSELLPAVARSAVRRLGRPVPGGSHHASTVAVGAALVALTLVATPDIVEAATPTWARPSHPPVPNPPRHQAPPRPPATDPLLPPVPPQPPATDLVRQPPSGSGGVLGPAGSKGDEGGAGAVVRPEVGPRPPRPPVDIEPPELDPPRSLVRSMMGRPLVLAGTGAVAAATVALTVMLTPGGPGSGEQPTPSPTSPSAAEVPQPLPGGGR